MNAAAAEAPRSELQRILALPRRAPLDCERERGTRRWAPEAQALVEVVTAQYSLGARLSCACRDRRLAALSNGRLLLYKQREGGARSGPPPLPVQTTIDAFCNDAAHDGDLVGQVSAMRAGDVLRLPGLGYDYCLTELNPVQSWALWELPAARGLFGMISVGGGKTILTVLSPLSVPDAATTRPQPLWVALIKPDQRIHYKRAYLRAREHFRVPSIVFDDGSGSTVVRGAPVLHVVPYSFLSNKKQTQFLERLDADGFLFDEMHLLGNKESARTMRVLRCLSSREDKIVAGWSGSTIKKSIKDCAHLAAHMLGLNSPYPIPAEEVEAWSAVMDPSVRFPDRTSSIAHALREAFGTRKHLDSALFQSGLISDGGIREGFRDRVVQTPGVVSTRSSSIACSITIRERKAPPMPEAVREQLTRARAGTRPDGEELADQLDIVACSREVCAGFYTYWAFPKATEEERAEGGLVDQWFEARKAFYKELREKLRAGEPHLDSRALCEEAAARAWQADRYAGDLPVWPAASWPAWAAIEPRVEPSPKWRWIDDYLARDAAAWALEHRGIVWCQSRAFALKVAEISGLPYCGGGPNAEERILAEDGTRSIVASIKAHGTGRDGLQHKFAKQLVAEIPASGDGWEQLIGRLAREGQPEDTVETWVYQHEAEFRDALRQAIRYAEFIEATTPNRQALLAADMEFEL